MAITGAEYFMLRGLSDAGMLPPEPAIMQFGESNWYGDLPISLLQKDIEDRVRDPAERADLLARLDQACGNKGGKRDSFEIARICYRVLTRCKSLEAIDMGGTDRAMNIDLNHPLDLGGRQFDLLLNIGTAEHVFNIYQVFKSAHEIVRPGGVMIHCAPFHGWVDHGFYTVQPTLYFDLAAANGYSYPPLIYSEINPPKTLQLNNRAQFYELVRKNEIGRNVNLFAIFRKPEVEKPFCIPHQGYYAGTLSEEEDKAWMELR